MYVIGRRAGETYPESAKTIVVTSTEGRNIWWRLDGTGDAQTWAQVMTLVAQAPSPATIWVSEAGPYGIPAGTYSMQGSTIRGLPSATAVYVVIAAHEVNLVDLAGIRDNVVLEPTNALGPALTFSKISRFTVDNALLGVGGVSPAIQVNGGSFCLTQRGNFSQIGAGVIDVINNGTVIANLLEGGVLASAWAKSTDTTGSVVYATDGAISTPFATLVGISSISISPLTLLGGTGTTAERPTPVIGTNFFDQDLGQPIWWNGGAWVDATGAPV